MLEKHVTRSWELHKENPFGKRREESDVRNISVNVSEQTCDVKQMWILQNAVWGMLSLMTWWTVGFPCKAEVGDYLFLLFYFEHI